MKGRENSHFESWLSSGKGEKKEPKSARIKAMKMMSSEKDEFPVDVNRSL